MTVGIERAPRSASEPAARPGRRAATLHRVLRARRHCPPGSVRMSGVDQRGGYRQPDLTLLGQEHVRRYRETDGAVGYLWNGVPTLLLTTRGRRSGEPRTTPLIFGRDGERLLGGGIAGRRAQTPAVVPEPSRISRSGDPGPCGPAPGGGPDRHGRREVSALDGDGRVVAELRAIPVAHRAGDPGGHSRPIRSVRWKPDAAMVETNERDSWPTTRPSSHCRDENTSNERMVPALWGAGGRHSARRNARAGWAR